jgi:hypothetical protein
VHEPRVLVRRELLGSSKYEPVERDGRGRYSRRHRNDNCGRLDVRVGVFFFVAQDGLSCHHQRPCQRNEGPRFSRHASIISAGAPFSRAFSGTIYSHHISRWFPCVPDPLHLRSSTTAVHAPQSVITLQRHPRWIHFHRPTASAAGNANNQLTGWLQIGHPASVSTPPGVQ